MNAHENTSESAADSRTAEAAERTNESRAAMRFALPMLLGLALAAGALGGVLVDRFANTFGLPPELARTTPPYSQEIQERVAQATLAALYRNTALSLGLFGLTLSCGLGVGAGIARGSARQAMLALPVGLVCGSLFGGLGGLADVLTNVSLQGSTSVSTTQRTMLMHAAGWAGISVAVALTVGLSAGRIGLLVRSLGAALGGGIIAALLYPLSAAFFFQMDNPELPIPDGAGNRMFWTMLVAALMGLSVGRTIVRTQNATGARNSRTGGSPSVSAGGEVAGEPNTGSGT